MRAKFIQTLVATALISFSAAHVFAAETNTPTPVVAPGADVAWAKMQETMDVKPPESWKTQRPTDAQKVQFLAPIWGDIAKQARDFYTKFPTDHRTTSAHILEVKMFYMQKDNDVAVAPSTLETAEDSLLSDPNLSKNNRLGLTFEIAGKRSPEKAKALYEQLLKSDAPDELKTEVAGELKTLNSLGKPVPIAFTAVDGRAVDLAKLKGKVVLIDFWATWCPPCVAEMPEVKKIYDQYHDKGFEIVGISLDEEKNKLVEFTAERHLDWPQYFDGLHWKNKIAVEFGIHSTPTLWLVDKKNNLRELAAGPHLEENVKKLLAE